MHTLFFFPKQLHLKIEVFRALLSQQLCSETYSGCLVSGECLSQFVEIIPRFLYKQGCLSRTEKNLLLDIGLNYMNNPCENPDLHAHLYIYSFVKTNNFTSCSGILYIYIYSFVKINNFFPSLGIYIYTLYFSVYLSGSISRSTTFEWTIFFKSSL